MRCTASIQQEERILTLFCPENGHFSQPVSIVAAYPCYIISCPPNTPSAQTAAAGLAGLWGVVRVARTTLAVFGTQLNLRKTFTGDFQHIWANNQMSTTAPASRCGDSHFGKEGTSHCVLPHKGFCLVSRLYEIVVVVVVTVRIKWRRPLVTVESFISETI